MNATTRRGDKGLGATPAGGNAGSFAAHDRAAAAAPNLKQKRTVEVRGLDEIVASWVCPVCGEQYAYSAQTMAFDGEPECSECDQYLVLQGDVHVEGHGTAEVSQVVTHWICPECGGEHQVVLSELTSIGTPICTDDGCENFDYVLEQNSSTVEINEMPLDPEMVELGRFIDELQREQESRGTYMATLRGGAPRVRPEVTVAGLTKMDRDGTLPRYIDELHRDFETFKGDNLDVLRASNQSGAHPTALFAAIDATDFLLRVKEDDAVRDPAFLSGEDDRVPFYLNRVIEVMNAPDRESALAALAGGIEGN